MDEDLSIYVAPVGADDPCGPDLRWDPEISTFESMLAQAFSSEDESAVSGATTEQGSGPAARDLVSLTRACLLRTKSISVLSVHARALWIEEGLLGFSTGMRGLVEAVSLWPSPGDGVHPRADEDDDLGERYAALSRIVHAVPRYAARIGWGKTSAPSDRARAAAALFDVFSRWESRFDEATRGDPPPALSAWRSLKALDGMEQLLCAGEAGLVPLDDAAVSGADQSFPGTELLDSSDPDSLLASLIEATERVNPHSPGLILLRLVATWKGLDLCQISERMAASGLALDTVLKSVKSQLDRAREV